MIIQYTYPMKKISYTLFLLALCSLGIMGQHEKEDEILLWPEGAPGSEGKTGQEKLRLSDQGDQVLSNIHRPSITPYLPSAENNSGTAIIVIPGGGHSEVWISHEGHSPAAWFRDHGIAAFVLKYRLARDENSTYTVDGEELADVQRAIRLVRSRAGEWNIDPSRIGVIGFSAGGELAGLAAMRYNGGDPEAMDPIDRLSCRPDFQILMYPAIRGLEASEDSPPVFIAGGFKDYASIARGMAELYLEYLETGIPAELHIYAAASHGFGIRETNRGALAQWPGQVKIWLQDIGMLP